MELFPDVFRKLITGRPKQEMKKAQPATASAPAETNKPKVKKEAQKMGRSTTQKLESAEKWIKKYGQTVATGKAAQGAVEIAKKCATETALLKAKLDESTVAKKAAMLSLSESLLRAKTERKLKQKEARVQAKISALSVALT